MSKGAGGNSGESNSGSKSGRLGRVASALPAAIGRPIAPGHIGQALQIRHKRPPALALVLGDDLLRQLDLLLQFGDLRPALLDRFTVGDLADAELGGFDTL